MLCIDYFQGRERNVAIAPQNGGRRQRQHMATSWILLQSVYNLYIILSQSFGFLSEFLSILPRWLFLSMLWIHLTLTVAFIARDQSWSALSCVDLASMTKIHLPAQSLHGVRQEWDGVGSSRISRQLTSAHNISQQYNDRIGRNWRSKKQCEIASQPALSKFVGFFEALQHPFVRRGLPERWKTKRLNCESFWNRSLQPSQVSGQTGAVGPRVIDQEISSVLQYPSISRN